MKQNLIIFSPLKTLVCLLQVLRLHLLREYEFKQLQLYFVLNILREL